MRLSNFSTPNRLRHGFTLVEVLVAAGLCMLIMVMITTAFQRAMDTLSQLKSVGEMQQRLRAFETAVRGDLEADHFEGGSGPRVRDQRLDLLNTTGLTTDTAGWRPPAMGFFRIMQENASTSEGTDVDGNPSTRAKDHILHMTVKRNASRGDRVFSAAMPGMGPSNWTKMTPLTMSQMSATGAGTLVSDWAEVIYFLDTNNSLGQTPGGTNLYGLYRRTRVIPGSGNPASESWIGGATPVSSGMSAADIRTASLAMSYSSVNGKINGPAEVRNPQNRLGQMTSNRAGSPTDAVTAEKDVANAATGSDLLLTDVISFEIKADWDTPTTTVPGMTILRPDQTNAATYEFPFGDLQTVTRNTSLSGKRVFDTWYESKDASGNLTNSWLTAGNAETLPMPIRVRAIQLKVRVWDRKNNMARQVTIVQDL